jgi:DNA mismatch repair protein MutS
LNIYIENIDSSQISNDDLQNGLHLFNYNYKIYRDTINDEKIRKLAYQESLLETVYLRHRGLLDISQQLGLDGAEHTYSRIALILMIEFIFKHDKTIIDKLEVPEIIINSDKYLMLANNCLEQLDIINKSSSETNLFNVINYTKTAIGKRFLSCQLSMPLIDPKELSNRYELINLLLESNHQIKIINLLEDIYDLDKLIRRLEISILNPNELHQIYESIHETERLCNYFKENKLLKSFDIDTKLVKQTSNLKQWIETRFQLNKINQVKNTPNSEVDCSFYNKGIHESIDKLQDQIDSAQNFMEYLIKELEKYIDDKVYFTKEKKKTNTKEADSDDNIKSDSKSLISLKYNDRDGHYMLITTRRCEILKKNLDKNKIKTLNVGSIVLNVNDLEFSELPRSSNTKINCKKVKDL